jgi:flagellar hook assembly protein FlgD
LPRAGATRLTIYDVLGRKVRTLVDDNEHRAGFYTAVWDGRDEHSRVVASGVYFYLLEAGTLRQARKMVLVQ